MNTNIPNTRYLFWIKSSDGFDLKSYQFGLNHYMTEDMIKEHLIEWCEKVYPPFNYSDKHITFGYEIEFIK